jgi:hypothetical protein
MTNHLDSAIGARVKAEHRSDAPAATKSEWVSPELRKFEISEVTANGGILSSDGITSS